jgi:hypothetical protein
MWISAISYSEKPISAQITKPVSTWKCEKIISHGCELAFHYQFLATGAPGCGQATFVRLKSLKSFFVI